MRLIPERLFRVLVGRTRYANLFSKNSSTLDPATLGYPIKRMPGNKHPNHPTERLLRGACWLRLLERGAPDAQRAMPRGEREVGICGQQCQFVAYA
jgi:hypothetical protein